MVSPQIHTHTHAQCSHASVGLVHTCLNYLWPTVCKFPTLLATSIAAIHQVQDGEGILEIANYVLCICPYMDKCKVHTQSTTNELWYNWEVQG